MDADENCGMNKCQRATEWSEEHSETSGREINQETRRERSGREDTISKRLRSARDRQVGIEEWICRENIRQRLSGIGADDKSQHDGVKRLNGQTTANETAQNVLRTRTLFKIFQNFCDVYRCTLSIVRIIKNKNVEKKITFRDGGRQIENLGGTSGDIKTTVRRVRRKLQRGLRQNTVGFCVCEYLSTM